MIGGYEWRGLRGPSLRELVGNAEVALHPAGIAAAFGERPATLATCIESAARLPPACQPEANGHSLTLADALHAALPPGRFAIALSGGVDSAVLAALGRDRVVAYTLVTGFAGYCEEREAAAIARGLGIDLRRVVVTEADFVRALPDAIRACETPLYNLHPVARLLLARAVREDGFTDLATGDGADEVFARRSGADYLPIVDALTLSAGVTPIAPFRKLHSAVAVIDPGKRALRALATSLGVPEAIACATKTPRYAPRMNLDAHWDEPRIAALARALRREPQRDCERAEVGWATLALFSRNFPGLAV